MSYLYVLAWSCLALTGCAEIKEKMREMDPTSNVYERFDGPYIKQVDSGAWSSNTDLVSAEFPNGMIMIRTGFRGVVHQRELENYLKNICNRLLANSPVKKVPFSIVITGSQGYGEAIATPDGVIAVPLGFLKSAESEDEIAWLLAHELSHIILRHHDVEWVEQYHEKSLDAAEQTLGAINLFNQIRTQYNSSVDTELYSAAEKALTVNTLLYKLNTRGLIPAWQRDQEDEADLMGTDLVVKSGYDLSQSIIALEKISEWAGDENKKIQSLLDRKKHFEEFLSELQEIPTLDQIKKYLSEFVQNEIDAFNNWASRTHQMAEKRIECLAEYIEREYEDVENDMTVATWQKVAGRRAPKTLLARYQNVWDAERALNDYRTAEKAQDVSLDSIVKKMRQAVRGENRYDSQPRIVFSELRKTQNKQELAIENLELALKERKPSMAVYKKLVNLYQTTGKPQKAKNILLTANQEFDNPPLLYPLRIKMEVLIGNQQGALNLTKECKREARKIYKACKSALVAVKPLPQSNKSNQQNVESNQTDSEPAEKKFWQIPAIPLPF